MNAHFPFTLCPLDAHPFSCLFAFESMAKVYGKLEVSQDLAIKGGKKNLSILAQIVASGAGTKLRVHQLIIPWYSLELD